MSAFSYKTNQPNNVHAWRMGEACQKAARAPSGDYIDTGLALLRELELAGFTLSIAPTPPPLLITTNQMNDEVYRYE